MTRRSTTQDISWFIDARRNSQLELDPPYQRRSVWTNKDRKFFLDTIFRGYPSPSIFLHKNVDGERTIYSVVDGKQRLQTIFLFIDGKLPLAPDFGDDRFNGKTWEHLGATERQNFWDYVLPVEFLTFDRNDTRAVNLAFDRLNRNMRKLEPQELRHARWDGWFITLVEKDADDPIWRKLGIVTNARVKRMKEVQFISELILVVIEGKQSGFDQQALDEAYAKYDDLDDTDSAINPDDVLERMNEVKNFLIAIEDTNGCVKDHATTFGTFYTLWSLVALSRKELPNAKVFAAKFVDFVKKVDKLNTLENRRELLSGRDADVYADPSAFLEASKGASTDLAPRQKRLEALKRFVLSQ